MSNVAAAAIAAATSLLVSILTLLLGNRQQRRRDEENERRQINSRYVNPLRLHLVENHYRLSSTLARVDDDGRCEEMLVLDTPASVSAKDAEWYNGHGCALLSSVYLTAGLFAQLMRVKEDFPYLRLSRQDDTTLAGLLMRVQLGYLENLGVYYVTQPSIGESVWDRQAGRVITYREFCERLRDPEWRVWFDKLISFHLDIARGERRDNADHILSAITTLSDFLDARIGGGHSIGSRWEAEATTFT
ncbi:hypothetical protein ABGB17_06895 [Sphaerisporangium sp. B11E5]|uniref:hypothetical protein n=1 Tax=Sphaerisporangium sp. B11E5 TaxID=3153563 RepID=UPI00325C99A1